MCLTHIFWLSITTFSESVTQNLTSFGNARAFPSDSIPSPSPGPAWCSWETPGWAGCAKPLPSPPGQGSAPAGLRVWGEEASAATCPSVSPSSAGQRLCFGALISHRDLVRSRQRSPWGKWACFAWPPAIVLGWRRGVVLLGNPTMCRPAGPSGPCTRSPSVGTVGCDRSQPRPSAGVAFYQREWSFLWGQPAFKD